VAFALTGAPVGLLDALLHAHEICPEHGEVLHVPHHGGTLLLAHSHHHAPVEPPAGGPSISPEETGEKGHDHELCWLAVVTLDGKTSHTAEAVLADTPGSPVVRERGLRAAPYPLYLLAPGHSPPAASLS
jgi:hypothetical protein